MCQLHGVAQRLHRHDLRLTRHIFRSALDRRADLIRCRAAEDQQLDMRANFRPERIERNMLIVTAGNQNDPAVEAVQPRDGARGAAGNGIVVIAHAVQLAHQLDAKPSTAQAAAM